MVGRRRAGRLHRGQLRAIVGIELPITRIEGKRKLSQNRPGADIAGAIDGLSARHADERAVAALDHARR